MLIMVVATTCADSVADVDSPDPTGDEYRERLHQALDVQIATFTMLIEGKRSNVDLYSRRGDAVFFRGKFADAVRDFDNMVALRPSLETSHWRRGIALFYAGRYNDAARQFEVYHSFDNVDRENGIWRYLSQVKATGKEQARQGLLKYEKDDREPFPDLYRLFAGELTGSAVLDRIAQARLPDEERQKRLFYAELYIGLNDFVEGDPASAEQHLRAAVRNRWGAEAEGGPGWMWHVARVHHDLLRREREEAQRKAGARDGANGNNE
jgi:lipoprotein NlpI